MTKQSTWSMVKDASSEAWTDLMPCGDGLYTETIVYEIVWIEADDGIYSRSLKIGESAHDVVSYYKKRGRIDADATYFEGFR